MDSPTADARLPIVIAKPERTVRHGFWRKIRSALGRVPFAEEAVAAYYCATDPATPARVKAILLAALAYFVVPTDMIPDFVLGLGYSDDATVLLTAVAVVGHHITPAHLARARAWLDTQAGPAGDDR